MPDGGEVHRCRNRFSWQRRHSLPGASCGREEVAGAQPSGFKDVTAGLVLMPSASLSRGGFTVGRIKAVETMPT